MVNIYNDIKHEIIERLAYDLLKDFDLAAEKIKPGNMIDIMLMVEDQTKMDIEKKEGFSQNNDLKVDFVAACRPQTDKAMAHIEVDDLFDRFAQKQQIEITKKGKHFQSDNFDYLMVFFYDQFIDANQYNRYEKPGKQEEMLPDYTLLIKSEELIKHIQENSDYYFNRIEIKRKTNNQLINKVDSSFINVPVDRLRKETDCLFFPKLEIDREEIVNYLAL